MNNSTAELKQIAIHLVGNKTTDPGLVLSPEMMVLDEELNFQLKTHLLKPFDKIFAGFHFAHESSLQYNEVYNYAQQVFDKPAVFHEMSQRMAKHLFECSAHPKIKTGEFYVVYFTDVTMNGQTSDAIGLFKTETKNGFFEVDLTNKHFSIRYKEGVDLSKVEKGCLILNNRAEEGYEVYLSDGWQKNNDAQYWRDAFLSVTPIQNAFHKTNQFLTLTKSFVTKQLDQEYELTKPDQIDLLNRSVAYFKTNDTFEKDQFEKTVLQDEGLITSFRSFNTNYTQENELTLPEQFPISSPAVKRQERVFKSVLKLDKNFHIYIHGRRDWIEQGTDPNGRKFYKIYYEQES